MEENEMKALRKECMALAVDSGAHCSEVVLAAAQFYNYIINGDMPGAQVIPFPKSAPQMPNS